MTTTYLDGFSTTLLSDGAWEAMQRAAQFPSNAGSPHIYGDRAAEIVEVSRKTISDAVGCDPSELIFTSGATEANNLAIFGATPRVANRSRRKIIVSSGEHHSVLEPVRELKMRGFDVCEISLLRNGQVDLEAFLQAIDSNTLFVSVMLANNVTGIVQPVTDIAHAARRVGALSHCDAAQAIGKIPVQVSSLGVDYMTFSGHKIHGPMGVGALFASADAPRLAPLFFGGGQEGGVRPGTVPVPLVAGLAAAIEEAMKEMDANSSRGVALADLLVVRLEARQVRITRLGEAALRIPGSVAAIFAGVDAQDLIARLSGRVQLSSGSACEAGSVAVSHVVTAMGFAPHEAKSFIRMLIAPTLTEEEVDRAADAIGDAYQKATLATGEPHQ